MRSRIEGRVLAQALERVDAPVPGVILTRERVESLLAVGVTAVRVRSPLTCQAPRGLCQQCYGLDLATGELVRLGTAVGILAAQSVGEPGTQLTMRTFHSGGIANAQGDITQGLPRVEELFEAKKPAYAALLSACEGVVEIMEHSREQQQAIRVLPATGTGREGEERTYLIPLGKEVLVTSGQQVNVGTPLTSGPYDPHEVLHIQGRDATARYLVGEVQRVYRATGVFIADKHVECLVRQMLRCVKVSDPGDTRVLPGTVLERATFERLSANSLSQGGSPAMATPLLLGLTESVFQTDSWLAAASFQQTSKVLAWAAIWGKLDYIQGYKNNVVLGQRIPTQAPAFASSVPEQARGTRT